ncbi:rhamnulokinase family protein [Actinoplanes sp. NPDC051470]|uniref:rhamnulokinase n=1 Tax=Actinoplanes sp. NPDC051470 TaxID=3157224 RepID=UPI003442461B
MKRFAAVDLGASSGRVMVGAIGGDGRLDLTEVHRFPNEPVRVRDTLHWDVLALYRGVLEGLRAAGPVDGIGIDSWAVDYGLIDADGRLLGNPVHYRDSRTDGVFEPTLRKLGEDKLYALTGLQKLPFNTIYQLLAEPLAPLAHRMLLIPDLIAYWLTGEVGAELTNASTTQLLDVRTGRWAAGLIDQAGIPGRLLPPLRAPGSVIGSYQGTPVFAVGSHDTASAVVGVPAADANFAYISCGTWSLVGVELDEPVLSDESRTANFTNEGGVDGTIRYLRNVMGLWLLQECQREWNVPDVRELLDAAEAEPFAGVIDVDQPVFLPPGDMPGRIAAALPTKRSGRGAIVRCILDSLALAHRRAIRQAAELSGKNVDVVHIVGGGARNELLCQLTADACGKPVLAGPVEATALGNVLVQARAAGVLDGGLPALRSVLRETQQIRRYEPRGDPDRWQALEDRLWG